MLKLMRFLKPYFWQVVLLLIATGGEAFFSLQIPALMAEIVNNGIVGDNTDYVWQQGLIMLGMAGLATICSLASSFFSAKVGAKFSRDLRAEVYEKVLTFNLADNKDFSTASLINRTTNDIEQIEETIMTMLSVMLFAPMFCIFAIVMAVQTAPDMSWIVLVGIIAIVISATAILVAVIPKFEKFQKLIDRATLLTRENLTGLRVIRAFNNEKIENRKFKDTNSRITKLSIATDKLLKLEGPLVNIIFNGMTLLCIYVGVSLLDKDYAYLGNMSAFAQYVSNVMMAFLMLSMLFVMIPRANVSAKRVNAILTLRPKIRWREKTAGVPSKRARVEFRNVSFSYPGAEEKVLDKISFVAEAGKTTAFIGSTGSGKSTLINLVPRFYEATSGEVLVDGINAKDFKKEDLMRRIGLVPQKGVLFSGTVKSNIKFGAPDATDAQMRKAARIAQAENFIEKMPEKYNSHIAQGGTNVSGGQKQRLSIARAICKDPDIFIFDDAFSALDMKTDAKLRAALSEVTADAVVLIVAQRVSTIKNAEQIIVLDDGRAVGKGTHEELLKSSAVYRSIVESQLSEKEFKAEMKNAK